MKNKVMMAAFIIVVLLFSTCGCIYKNENSQTGIYKQFDKSLIVPDSELSDQVPKEIKENGLTVVADFIPPAAFRSEQNSFVFGYEIDFVYAITRLLNLKVNFEHYSFQDILLSASENNFDLGVAAISYTKERLKSINMVRFMDIYHGFVGHEDAMKQFNPNNLNTLCGHSISVMQGTLYEEIVRDQSKKCDVEHKKPLKVKSFLSFQEEILALTNKENHVDFVLDDSPQSIYVAVNNPKLEYKLDFTYRLNQVIAIPKKNKIAPIIKKAVQKLIDDGWGYKILNFWNVADSSIKTAKLYQ